MARLLRAFRRGSGENSLYSESSNYAALAKAINEYALTGFEMERDRALVGLTFLVAADPSRFPDQCRRVLLVLYQTTRVCAELRIRNAVEVVPMRDEIVDLGELVERLGTTPSLATVADLSIDATPLGDLDSWWPDRQFDEQLSSQSERAHSVGVLQESDANELEVIVWFDGFEAFDDTWRVLDLDELVESNEEWWSQVRQNRAQINLANKRGRIALPCASSS